MVHGEFGAGAPIRIAWPAVAAGSLVALGVQLTLAILGLGVGLGAVDVVSGEEASSGAITAAVGVWWSVAAITALFLGGWVAGRIAGRPFAPDGIFLAALMWAVVTLASFYITTPPMSTVLGGPIAVATESVYGVIAEAELQPLDEEIDEEDLPEAVREDIEEDRAEAARRLAARAEGAIEAGLWVAFTLVLGGGAALAGVWLATEPPAWTRPRRIAA